MEEETLDSFPLTGVTTRVEEFSLEQLKLLDINARFMRHETFQRLVENVRRDGGLTSVPFATRQEDGTYLVVSGNHRVMAAKEAGLEFISVMVTDDDLSEDRIKAIQIAHNALVGEDDEAVLIQIFDSIQDLDLRLYTGLDDKILNLFDDVEPDSLNDAALRFQTISFNFLPEEVHAVESVFAKVKKEFRGTALLARWSEYDRFMDALEETGDAYHIRNVGTVLSLILDVFENHRTDLAEGWCEGEAVKHKGWVPLASVLGNHKIPAESAALLKKRVEVEFSKGKHKNRIQAFDALLRNGTREGGTNGNQSESK